MPIPNHRFGCTTKTYPMKCKVCRAEVYHFACSCGSSILFDSLDTFVVHELHPMRPEPIAKPRQSICIRLGYPGSKPLREAVQSAARRWRYLGVLEREPERIASLKYEIWLSYSRNPAILEPLSDLLLAGIAVEIAMP